MQVPQVFEDAVLDKEVVLTDNIEDLVNKQSCLADAQERTATALEDILEVLQEVKTHMFGKGSPMAEA